MARSEGKSFTIAACGLAVLLAAVAGCSGVPGLGRSEEKPVDPNAFPANYRTDVMAYLQNHPSEIDNVRDAALSAPTLGQLSGTESRYFVCLRTETADARKVRMIVFYAGQINQFIDGTGQQCSTATYQPFPEVAAAVSQMRGKK